MLDVAVEINYLMAKEGKLVLRLSCLVYLLQVLIMKWHFKKYEVNVFF